MYTMDTDRPTEMYYEYVYYTRERIAVKKV